VDKENFAKKGFIVAGASGIEVETEFLNPKYKPLEVKPDATTGDTGRLQLFRIDPIPSGLPAFLVRIGHDNHEAVDVDLIGDEAERVAFASQAPGYVGHKTRNLKTDPSSYNLNIEVPSVGRVFSGTLTMKGLGLGVRLVDELRMEAVMDAVVIRKSDKPTENQGGWPRVHPARLVPTLATRRTPLPVRPRPRPSLPRAALARTTHRPPIPSSTTSRPHHTTRH
jgi:hypothetical protein